MWNINAPQGRIPCDFNKICIVCTPFQDALAVKNWFDLLEGLWSYGRFKGTLRRRLSHGYFSFIAKYTSN